MTLQLRELVAVYWQDTTNMGQWLDTQELIQFAKDGAWDCINVGYLAYQDETCVVISARITEDWQHVGLTERIPKQAIVQIKRLIEP